MKVSEPWAQPSQVASRLRALPEGGWLWVEGLGHSLWPLLRSGDAVQVVRCRPQALKRGHIAVVQRGDGGLLAHLVVSVEPVRTASLPGREDAPGEVLGRVIGVRTRGRLLPVPALVRPVLWATPHLARAARRVPPLRALGRWLRARAGVV